MRGSTTTSPNWAARTASSGCGRGTTRSSARRCRRRPTGSRRRAGPRRGNPNRGRPRRGRRRRGGVRGDWRGRVAGRVRPGGRDHGRRGGDDAAATPPWWTAGVTAHDLRTPHVAVLTLRPGEPFPYMPGQHLSVQTPRWPRLWRRYSIANAPRDDGLLTLHVRAVDGGLVSNTLVHHLQPGDTLLLGPAEGRMTADSASGRPVLCLAGGTGLAPLTASRTARSRCSARRPAGRTGTSISAARTR
jgi:Oxidoreductase FAD-binding domain